MIEISQPDGYVFEKAITIDKVFQGIEIVIDSPVLMPIRAVSIFWKNSFFMEKNHLAILNVIINLFH